MFSLFFRGMILYIAMILLMRGLGKRQLGEFQPYEFAMTILLADVIAAPMESVSTPLLHGLLPVGAMFAVHGAVTLLSLKSDKARAVLSGKPSVVIRRGVIDEKQLDRLCLSLADLLEGLRGAGFLNPDDVGTAIVEANGTISAFPKPEKRQPTAQEMGVQPPYEGLPMILVMDGRIQKHNLARTGKDEKWLADRLNAQETYLASLDTQGRLLIQDKTGSVRSIEAMKPQEVIW